MTDWMGRLGAARSIGEQDDDLSVTVKVADIRAALAEVERLRVECDAAYSREATTVAEKEAEVERLKNKLNSDSQAFQIECLNAEVARLRALMDALHLAVGEDPASDDASLPGVVATALHELHERVAYLEAEVERLTIERNGWSRRAGCWKTVARRPRKALRTLLAEVEREYGEQPGVESVQAAKRLL